MDMSTRLCTGGPAYPGFVAIQRGPQLLALDATLNRNVQVWLAGFDATNPASKELAEAASRLPSGWAGLQAYEVPGFEGNDALGRKKSNLVFVPIADAGQNGNEYRVWVQAS